MSKALLVIDVQNDFCEGGSLAVNGGAEVAAQITDYIAQNRDNYDVVVATKDYHTHQTEGHFAPEGQDPDFAGTWPVHCMSGENGSEFHPDLSLDEDVKVFYKGQKDASYSGFDGTDAPDGSGIMLDSYLQNLDIEVLDVVGIAYDFCVAQTALDGRRNGYKVRVLRDLTASVSEPTATAADTEMRLAGVEQV